MASVASQVPFSKFCLVLEKIKDTQGTDAKKKILKTFIDEWRACHNKIHKDDHNTNDSFFPAMRLLLPQLEKEREAYGIKEYVLARMYIEILSLGKESPSAKKLLNYRTPKGSKSDAGDFAAVAFWILKPRCPENGKLTLEDVNTSLDKLAAGHAAKDKVGVRNAMRYLIQNTSAQEQKWLIRMILKELKIGLSQQSVFAIFHQDAEDLYNVKMSLEKVCTMLRDPDVRLHEIEISIFSPFRPMLGDRANPNKVEELFKNKSFYIETKFDGERIQVHKQGDEYKYFSRSGNDYTHIFGSNPFTGNLTPYISNCFHPSVKNVIMDGELVAYYPETQTIGYKGQNMDMKSIHTDGAQPLVCLFDVLLLNDKVLSNKTLSERKEILHHNILTPVEGRIVFSEYKEASTIQDCIDALNEAIERHDEGLMVKDPLSAYKPNTRRGGWYKIKPEYIGGLMDELDVIVVGGFMGVGHRRNMMSHFLCALAVPPADEDSKPTEFHSFCRVGSGYTRKELYEFNKLLLPHWQPFNKKNPPSWLKLASGLKQKPDAIIEPSKSKILQIKAAEIQPSDQYKTGYTLRFPRVERIREDKPWYQCMTVTEVEQLQQKCSGKLTGRLMEADDEDDKQAKKRHRKLTPRYAKPTLMATFKGIDTSAITQKSEIFRGKEFCVMASTDSHSKSDLEKLIAEFGGTITQHPGEDTFCVLTNKVSVRVKNIITKNRHDVINIGWLLRCVDCEKCLPWKPADLIHITPESKQDLANDFDCFGDSYYDETDPEDLKRIFQEMDESSVTQLAVEDIAELEMKYFPHDSVYGLFRLCRVYLDVNRELNNPGTHIAVNSLEFVRIYLKFYGSTVVETIDTQTSHVIVHSSDLSRVKALHQLNRSRDKKLHIVSEQWVYDCIDREKLLPEKDYGVRCHV